MVILAYAYLPITAFSVIVARIHRITLNVLQLDRILCVNVDTLQRFNKKTAPKNISSSKSIQNMSQYICMYVCMYGNKKHQSYYRNNNGIFVLKGNILLIFIVANLIRYLFR